MSYLWWDDVEEVSRGGVFLAEHIALIGLEQNVEYFDDERAATQRSRQTVFTQETAQLGFVLIHILQSQFSA